MPHDKIVIAHRGACGYLPEHTLPAYALAYGLGADYLEPDVVMTADHELICLHDIHLDATTDVACRYPDRARGDGRWYAADFSWAEIRGLNARERTDSTGTRVFAGRYGDHAQGFSVPRLVELLELVAALNRQSGRNVGIYPETKQPSFHAAEGLPLETALLDLLAGHGYAGRSARLYIQSFEAANLRRMRTLGCELPMIQLIEDLPAFDTMVTGAGLDAIAVYADGIGPDKQRIVATDGALVAAAHERGLVVHPFTFRADQLPPGTARLENELERFYHHYDVDGLFTDFADIAVGVIHPERRARLHPR